jgi:hypothetical protein
MARVDSMTDLRRFDVFPFPLATSVHWTDTGFELELVIVMEARDDGYASMPIASHTVPYTSGHPSEHVSVASVELEAALRDAWRVFAVKLARALRD